jgi:hypothetical protein
MSNSVSMTDIYVGLLHIEFDFAFPLPESDDETTFLRMPFMQYKYK